MYSVRPEPISERLGLILGKNWVAALTWQSCAERIYAGGTLTVNIGSGSGYTYTISDSTETVASGVITVTLERGSELQAALTAGDTVTLIQNPFNGVILFNGSLGSVGIPLGVSLTAAESGEYALLQVKGYASCLSDGIIASETGVIPSDTVEGALAAVEAATTVKTVGNAVVTTTDGQVDCYNINFS